MAAKRNWNRTLLMVGLLVLMFPAMRANAQLRIVNYNTKGDPSSPGDTNWQTLLAGIGNEQVNGIAHRPAIVALVELSSGSYVATMLNGQFHVSSYTNTDMTAGSERYGVVYDASQVQLLESLSVYMDVRPALRCKWRPVGYSSDAACFYTYTVHLKAYAGATYELTRLNEVTQMRQTSDLLAAGTHIIYLGDFNLTGGAAEAAYSKMLSAGNGQAFDPQLGMWSAPYYTYSSTSPYSRIDFQFLSAALTDGKGVSLIANSYHPYGNNNGSTSQHPELKAASDHLPVVADYQVPAKMVVQVGSVPPRVLKNASASVPVTVTNAAAVVAANGADTLDYVVSGTGAISGSSTGSALALGQGNLVNLAFDTTATGTITGQLGVSSSSQGVENGQFTSSPITISVLEHATPSFAAAVQSNLTIRFGPVRQGRSVPPQPFCVYDRADVPGTTAALKWDSITPSGDKAVLTTTLPLQGSVLSASSQAFSASVSTATAGSFASAYVLHCSDENLPGAKEVGDLTLMLEASVTALGDVDGNGVLDAADIDALFARFRTADAYADLDDSGLVNQADADTLVHDIFGTQYGDANLDRKVDVIDVLALADSWNGHAGWAGGDFNGDGVVDTLDLLLLASSWGWSAQ
jgi:hypothetical protein